MIADGMSPTIFCYSGSPDTDVHTSLDFYPNQWDFFCNTSTNELYKCNEIGSGIQVWMQIVTLPMLSDVATTGDYADLINKPTLATVATTGAYSDLTGKPSIPAAQIQSDWKQASTGSLDYIKNKPSLATVATSGSYNDLSDKPSIPSAPLALSFSTPTFSSVTTATQLSSTRDAYVVYTFPTSMTSLVTSQALTATLQFADDSGFTTNVVSYNSDTQGCSGILSLTLTGRLQVQGIIPAGKYRRVTLGQTGGATVPTTLSTGQEVLL